VGRASHLDGTAVDTEVGWSALLDVIADTGGLDDVAAMSIPGQPHGMGILDADGRVILDALVWNGQQA
jgi:xylulokinase